MELTNTKNILYFSSGVVVGYLLGCTIFMIVLIFLISLTLMHRKKITSLYSGLKKTMHPSLIHQKTDNILAINPSFSKNSKIDALINSDINIKINEYSQWANIDNIGCFIEKAARIIFEKDKDWKAHQRSVKRTIKQSKGL